MNRFSGSMITQQMYTRERRGVYRATEGFDTVAKSESLDNNFVKKILHPFCLYDAPAELAARGEKDEELYPAALHLFHTESNETVIGLSRYLAADFTGQRSAFFAHNFVVPPIRSEEIVEGYGEWLHAGFARSYEGEPGGTLPELADIPVEPREGAADPLAVLGSLGFTEQLFKALLQAVMLSVAGKKKIYVALDVPISELSQRAVELTEVLYAALPHDFRRRLGVITYAKEPQSRKYIHLTFVEKGSLRPGDRSIEKDYIFDLAGARILNADFGESRQMYADLAWKTLGQKGGSLRDFARFADSLLLGESVDRKLSLALYNELAVFYEIEQGDEDLYTGNKNAVLGGLLSYLKPEGALESRVRLNDMFLERFDREYDLIRKKGVPAPEILEWFKEYYALPGHNYRVKIVDYFINGMLNCQSAGREDALAAAYGIIEGNDELSAAFFKRVLAQPIFRKALLEPYMESRLADAPKSADILRFVAHWGRFLPEALQQAFVRDTVKEYLLEKLQRDNDPVAAVASVHESVQKAEKERRRGGGVHPEALSLLQDLGTVADRFLLNRISLDELTMEQLLEISFLRYRDTADWQPPLDAIAKRKANALRAAYRWFGEEKPDEEIFAGLSPRELDDVQLLGGRWLKESRSIEPFERLPLAFYHSSEREGGPLDYDALLELVARKAGNDKETVYRFLAWSQHNRLFTISSKKLWPNYRRAVLKYFLKNDREAFKNRDFRKSYSSAATPAMQNVYNEARSQLASPLARWVSRSRFQILISGSVLGIVLIIAIIAISWLRPDADTAAPQPTVSPVRGDIKNSDGQVQAPVSVRLVGSGVAGAGTGTGAENGRTEGTGNAGGGEGGGTEGAGNAGGGESGGTEGTGNAGGDASSDEAGVKLVFSFAAVADCSAFNPAEIIVMSGNNVADTYKVVATASSCLAAGVDGGSDEGAVGTDGGGDGAAGNSGGTGEAGAGNDGGTSGNAAAGNSGGTGEAGAGVDGGANGEAAEASPAAGASGAGIPARVYEVTVELEPGAKLAADDMITAGIYTLKLQASPGSIPGSTPSTTPETTPGTDPTPSASPDTDAE
ncbi:glycosyltransferase [Paenibacillus sp. FSL R7-0312]|uniref:GAP1-N2 domain-containing protein n=1 Tax=Paenibacillus sp. FSL R7-0312 TaxID=2921682 RepID=UPI0030FA8849